ncbi:sulfite exporter TauE/SafE family protein [Neorhodopirellula pilleata]|uniref:sulfite exporter TauE/SafE family protein n=1 Tax=Neorhodopirellula pilleata TaxID=2714738 RepID=UPI001E456E6B|nr:sulfite exporter TauE/SafE family protein [Neorhodopirellula pilleata]
MSAAANAHGLTVAQRLLISLGRIKLFLIWLACFYLAWLLIVVLGGHWDTVVSHWPIALAMSFGSYIAGSTPMGGGTVGFPVLVLIFDMPGSLGRNFGLAVQSIGMVSASIYILNARRPLHWRLLGAGMLGSLIGTPFGAAFVAPFIPDLWVKLLFGVVWASFGIMHLVKLKELVGAEGITQHWRRFDWPIGLGVGIIGGIVASITGVGIDMIIYATLVLLYRADLKISIPTSVCLMAFTSVIGIVANVLLSTIRPDVYKVDPEVFANWLAAAPVVAIGAPLGAVVVELIARKPTLLIVSALCILQFVWTLIHEQVSGTTFLVAILAVLVCNGIFHVLYSLGHSPEVDNNADNRIA